MMAGTAAMNPIEAWARRFLTVREVDSVARTYRGEGPPSWRCPWPEVEGELSPARPGDWWPMVRLVDLLEAAGGARLVLDLGSGPGWPAVPLARKLPEVVALDASELAASLLEAARAHAHASGLRIVRGDASRLPFPDGTFDAVVMVDLLDVVPDPLAVAREVRRVLRPGGRVCSHVQDFRYVLGGHADLWQWGVVQAGESLACEVHHASLNAPHTLDLRFPLDARHPRSRAPAPLPMADTDPDTLLAHLERLRPAMLGVVEVYRTTEFVLETAAQPFAEVGLADLRVRSLDDEACGKHARDLVRTGALPDTPAAFEAAARGLLEAMSSAEGTRGSCLSVHGTRPRA